MPSLVLFPPCRLTRPHFGGEKGGNNTRRLNFWSGSKRNGETLTVLSLKRSYTQERESSLHSMTTNYDKQPANGETGTYINHNYILFPHDAHAIPCESPLPSCILPG